jgi:hypothetical protein
MPSGLRVTSKQNEFQFLVMNDGNPKNTTRVVCSLRLQLPIVQKLQKDQSWSHPISKLSARSQRHESPCAFQIGHGVTTSRPAPSRVGVRFSLIQEFRKDGFEQTTIVIVSHLMLRAVLG